jgi:alpha,alpha-trehalase
LADRSYEEAKMELQSVIFDMDGVITDTAKVHFKAWKQIFDEYLKSTADEKKIAFKPFTLDDYIHYVDGMSRIDGVKCFLQSRHIIGSSDKLSSEDQNLIQSLSTKKNEVFLELIKKEGVTVFPGTLALIKELKKNKIKIAAISSSKNCKEILTQGYVIQYFQAIVDGNALKECHLKGKPNPDIFLEAAKRLQADPAQSVVIEDALSGVIAGKAGHFGLVIGIDRQKKWQSQFKQKGADIVVNDLSEIDLDQIKKKLIQTPLLTTDNFNRIKKNLQDKRVIICSDFDGTLTPIVRRPELATLSNEVKDLLFQLHQHASVVIISGRELSDIETKVGINGLYYAGNHGFEIIGPEHFTTKFVMGSEYTDEIEQVYNELSNSLTSVENCIIENKKYSLSVHFRMVRESSIPEIKKNIEKIIVNHPRLIKYQGKKVFEIRPNINWNKGKALKFILEKLNYNPHDFTVIYLGDDVTDEDAFKEIKSEKGIGILISDTPRVTNASYRLAAPSDVEKFLKDLLAKVLQSKLEITDSSWKLTYTEFEPDKEKLREALCTLGNGYFATRGASEESSANEIHYPGTYFAGTYNKLKSIVADKEVYNEDLVNMPNWLPLTFKILDDYSDDGEIEWFSLQNVKILKYLQELDIQRGILKRKMRIQDNKGRISRLEFTRFVSMANPHLAGQRMNLIAENWSGHVLIRSGLDGSVINSGVDRYRGLNSKHLEILKIRSYRSGRISLLVRTNQSHVEVGYSAIHRLYQNGLVLKKPKNIVKNSERIYCFFEADITKGNAIKLEKLVAISKNKDPASSDCLTDTKNILNFVKRDSFDSLLQDHTLSWRTLWRNADLMVESEGDDQRILRLHIFHLLQTASRNSIDLDIGVPARGLHGESYRGHIFWDELFIMPFYTFYFPEMARSLLLYRYRRLNMARLLAKKSGYLGAMFPWQSGSNGDEVTQPIHLNPRSNEWLPDYSHYQRHVNGAIAYNIWQYYLATNDTEFMSQYGLEMILEIARFWASIATFNQQIGRYEIHHVVGPDEYHEKYPWNNGPGVSNNTYTNILAVWTIERALELLTHFNPLRCQEVRHQIQLGDNEIERWQDMSTKMFIPFHDTNIISQFSGYEKLPEFNWDYYQTKYGNIERLDRILKAENDSPDNYKVSKQADVIMLFYLFSYEQVSAIFEKLGYPFNKNILLKNIFYYLKRTSHGSTLSKVVLASLARYIDQEIALKFYQDVLNSDIMDIQGGTTAEGIHLGAMASCLNINLMCFAGLEIKNNMLSFSPRLPARISKLQFNLQFRQQWLHILIYQDKIDIKLRADCETPMTILINGKAHVLEPPREEALVSV